MLFVDERAYPISLDGALVAARVSDRLVRFPHNDPEALERLLRPHRSVQDNVIVCDGIYPLGGRVAALRAFAALAERYGAAVYVDDAHGIGILGEEPSAMMPLGFGGGGTPRQLQVGKGSIVHVGGLGKALRGAGGLRRWSGAFHRPPTPDRWNFRPQQSTGNANAGGRAGCPSGTRPRGG